MAKTPAKKAALKPAVKKAPAKKKAAKKTPVTTVPRVKAKKPKLPWRERFRLAWHVLKGNNICD